MTYLTHVRRGQARQSELLHFHSAAFSSGNASALVRFNIMSQHFEPYYLFRLRCNGVQ